MVRSVSGDQRLLFLFLEGSYKIKGRSGQALHLTEEVTQAHRRNAAARGQSRICVLVTHGIITVSGNAAVLHTRSIAHYV